MISKESFEDVMLDMAWRNYEDTLQWTRDLDTKGHIIIGIGGLLSTLSIALLVNFTNWLFGIPSFLFFISVLLAILAIKFRKYEMMDTIGSIESFSKSNFKLAKRELIVALGGAQKINRAVNGCKVKYLQGSLYCIAVGLITLITLASFTLALDLLF